MQQITLEYRVAVALDGVTPSPVFSVDPSSPDYKAPDPDGIYRFEVDNLGWIDPDFDVGGTQGDRFLRAALVEGPNAPAGFAGIALLALYTDTDPVTVIFLQDIAELTGTSYRLPKGCFEVPQGAVLGVTGLEGNPGEPVILRISVDVPDSLVEYAEMMQACCCEQGEDECIPTSVSDIAPDFFFPFEVPLTLTVTGSGFVDGVTVVDVVQAGGFPSPGVDFENVTIVSDTELTLDITSAFPGAYDIVVSNGEGCSSSGQIFVQTPA